MSILILGPLTAQTVSNIRVSRLDRSGYYAITFDLSGDPEECYAVKVVPCKQGQEIPDPKYLGGQGIKTPCSPGKDLQVFWSPMLEGVDWDGWEFR